MTKINRGMKILFTATVYIIDFNVDPQFNMLTCEIHYSNNFDSIKQLDTNKFIYYSNKKEQ